MVGQSENSGVEWQNVQARYDIAGHVLKSFAELSLFRNDAPQLAAKLTELQLYVASTLGSASSHLARRLLASVLLIVDSVASTRGHAGVHGVMFPAAKSDQVAESGLALCKGVLNCCEPQQLELFVLLERLHPILALPSSAASEEVRGLAIDCVNTLLQKGLFPQRLSSEDASTMICLAHQLLLKAQDEVLAGQKGSKTVLASAMGTLKEVVATLVRAGGTPHLAVILPGLVSKTTQILLAAGTSHGPHGRTGAVASTKATTEAVHVLFSALCATLADDEALDTTSPEDSSATFMEPIAALKHLDLSLRRSRDEDREEGPGSLPKENKDRASQQVFNREAIMRRDPMWKSSVVLKLRERLVVILQPLLAYPKPAIRRALAEGIIDLMRKCQKVIQPCTEELIMALFTLAQDDWSEVSLPCMAYLRSSTVASTSGRGSQLPGGDLEHVTLKLISGLSSSLQQGDVEGLQHVRRLLTAIQVVGGNAFRRMLKDPGKSAVIVRSLLNSLAFERAGAALLLYTNVQGIVYTTALPSHQDEIGSREEMEGAHAVLSKPTAMVVLPRMPLGLALISSSKTYEAVAALCQTIGRLAAGEEGSLALQSIVEQAMSRLQCILESRNASDPSILMPWQCQAASVVTLLAELVFGASPACMHHTWLAEDAAVADNGVLTDLVAWLQQEFVQESLWGVQIHNSSTNGRKLTPQELGENVMIVRVLLEAVGTFARSMGTAYAESGALLRVTVMPLLELLGTPCQAISVAADDVVESICQHCNYAGIQEMVSANIDYVIDALCRQLRDIEMHPRAPFLFAVLLRKTGVGPALLALLAEPARVAIRHLAITARCRRPGHILAFLAALREIAASAALDACGICKEMQALAGSVAEAIETRKAERRAVGKQSNSDLSTNPGCQANSWDKEGNTEAKAFFRRRMDDRDAEAEAEAEAEADRMLWSDKEASKAFLIHQRLHSNALLAATAVEAGSPLLASKDSQVILLAMELSKTAIEALATTTAALEVYETQIEPFLESRSRNIRVSPDTPKVLPQLVNLWGPLLVALKDSRIVIVEHAVALLPLLATASGGQFLANRVRTEAWPAMLQLLCQGPSQTQTGGGLMGPRRIASGQEPHAEVVVQRARQAVLGAILSMARGEVSKLAVKGIVPACAEAIMPYIAGKESAATKSLARQALFSLAHLDSDVVWLELAKVVYPSCGKRPPPNPKPAVLKPWHKIFPSRSTKTRLPQGMASIAALLLQKVETIRPAWEVDPKKTSTAGEVAASDTEESIYSNSMNDEDLCIPV